MDFRWLRPRFCYASHKELELTERLRQAAQEGGAPMDDLEKLIEAARGVTMTPDERERQRQSFAFGNAHIENEFVTRETISRAAAELESGDRE